MNSVAGWVSQNRNVCHYGDNYSENNSCFCFIGIYPLVHCARDKIKKNEIGGACGTCGGKERRVQGFGVET
jgi:Zn-finger protein